MTTGRAAKPSAPAAFRDGFLWDFIGMPVYVRGSASSSSGKVVDFLVNNPEDKSGYFRIEQ